jgi:hypothetical protein
LNEKNVVKEVALSGIVFFLVGDETTTKHVGGGSQAVVYGVLQAQTPRRVSAAAVGDLMAWQPLEIGPSRRER